MDPLQMLLDEREIRLVLYRRARSTDARDLEGALSCYHEDATEDHEGFDGPVREYLATASPVFVGESPIEVNYHLIGNTTIELDGDRAACESYFIAALTARENGSARDYINAGRYVDEFIRRDGVWRIQHRECIYDWSHGADVSDRWWTREALKDGPVGSRRSGS